MANKFTWIPTYKEIAQLLCSYENRQKQLIEILKKVGVTQFNDYNFDGSREELKEIDPFTFFCYINKYSNERRVNILRALHSEFGLSCPKPTDVLGVPTSHPIKVWLFGYKKDRSLNDIPTLWKLFYQTIRHSIDNETFEQALRIRNVGKGKLSICWFYTDPDYYLPLDSNTSKFLRENKLKYIYSNIDEYKFISEQAQQSLELKPFEISAKAFNNHNKKAKSAPTKKNFQREESDKYYDNCYHPIGKETLEKLWHQTPDGQITSVTDLLNFVFEKSTMAPDNSNFFYRGHSDNTYNLLPGVYRNYHNIILNEHILFKEMESSVPSESTTCKCTFDRLVKMQHYGLPTRLLDITANPLVALFFACWENDTQDGSIFLFENNDDNIKYSDSDAVSVVANISRRNYKLDISEIKNLCIDEFNEQSEIQFLLHEIRCCEKSHFLPLINPDDLQSVFIVRPKMDNARIIKQEGAFFLFGMRDSKLECPSLGEHFDFSEYIIPRRFKSTILKQLEKMGITEATLFPEIDHVAKFIKTKYINKIPVA